MIWHSLIPQRLSAAGLIPEFLSSDDPRPAREQLHEGYRHGGGWQPFQGFTPILAGAPQGWRLEYPGDRPMRAMAFATLREETIIVFEYSWVAVVTDGKVEIARMD